jgi:hypothetical protein
MARMARGEPPPGSETADGSKMVQMKILETIKKGIDQSSRRALSEGERKMLDHMKTYLLEAKVAESNLNDQERKIWEEMKQEYLVSRNAGAAPPGFDA